MMLQTLLCLRQAKCDPARGSTTTRKILMQDVPRVVARTERAEYSAAGRDDDGHDVGESGDVEDVEVVYRGSTTTTAVPMP
jgi:hypothetical protein